MFSQFATYIEKRFTGLFSSKGIKQSKVSNGFTNNWSGFIIDIYSKSNYTLPLELIKQDRALEWLEVKDREANLIEQQNKLNEEANKHR